MEFHIARTLRDALQLDDALFRYTGDVVFANVAASRKLAQKWSELRRPGSDADSTINAGALFAMGLIDELNHAMVARFREQIDPGLLADALTWFAAQTSPAELERLLVEFTTHFPGVAIYRGETTVAEWLAGSTEGMPNREAAFEELMMLWLANLNPAFTPFRELFDDTGLKQLTGYASVSAKLPAYFETRPPLAPEIGTLLDALRAPMLASPDSLTGQLDFIRRQWAAQLGPQLRQVLLAVDVLREEDLALWMRFHPPGPGQHRHAAPGFGGEGFVGDEYVGFDESFPHDEYITGPDGVRHRRYASDYQAPLNEYEAFSADQAWMPNVVMMAKSTYVWLEQLSQKYGRHIHRLDQIPDEELQLLADRGITALWLIGLWERSTASRTIKRLRGHADAVASAYSLKEYKIAEDLAGNAGYESLRDRAGAFGIRLASDMVPNHMGIESNWVIEHPEWFISRWESPFPAYTFNGPDLSPDSRVEIKIEDHYYDQTDAAVAFRMHTYADSTTRFVYHGNDGTTFAWNDTAQLDYSKAAVREHVIQTILYVARLFPIIRFDAAMVLAKRHVQRLWFPLPGAGGAIPSRAEDAMSQEEFDALMPHEFWREVVDRVAIEVPGTLLLAEAFWLLEGYFVRTLGMHRVYNSAFMNMLRDEENAKYRSYLKKTVEFDPDILKRYVNFMSNPDERTAIDQFGSGDKFFGCCTLLATLPGLPMFGHGQIEGFTERYGMEFKQAKMRETPDEGLVARHMHEIAPLLKRRAMFAESEHFLLYDFWNGNGAVDENVFAYSNRMGSDRSVIFYNNSYASTAGSIHYSAASVDKGSGAMRERSLADGLALPHEETIVAWRDTVSGLEYLRRTRDLREQGLAVTLRGYQYLVLLDWRELRATASHPWDRLCDALGGAGVWSAEEALSKLRLRPLIEAIRQAIDAETLAAFAAASSAEVNRDTDPDGPDAETIADEELAPSAANGAVGATPSASAVLPTSMKEPPLAPAQPATSPGPPTLEPLDPRLANFVERSLVFYDRAVEHLPSLLNTSASEPGPAAGAPEPRVLYRVRCEAYVRAAASLASLEARFSTVWPNQVEEALPGFAHRPDRAWAPLLGWILLRSLAVQGGATKLFDDLEARAALAEVFSGLGLEGEQTWQAAAQVRVLLALPAGSAGDAARSAAFWTDPDVRWLAGVHEAFGITYLNKERFETMLCWLQLPALLAGDDLDAIEAEVDALCHGAEHAGYRVDRWLDPIHDSKQESKSLATEKVR